MSQFNPSHTDGSAASGVDDRVAEAVARLDDLAAQPTTQHVDVFESVHETLSQTLSAVDEA